MAREQRKSWRDSGSSSTQSYRAEGFEKYENTAKQNAVVKEYRAALEALFQKKPEGAEKIEKMMPSIVLPRVVEASGEPAVNKRQEMLRKITLAQGTRPISDAFDTFLSAGHTLPDDQEIFLQMLEHRDEERVREALAKLDQLLMGQLPKRKPVLVQRLKRLEELAEEPSTREAAVTLRRKVA